MKLNFKTFLDLLMKDFEKLKNKRKEHPELFGVEENAQEKEAKVLLDALYEEGLYLHILFQRMLLAHIL